MTDSTSKRGGFRGADQTDPVASIGQSLRRLVTLPFAYADSVTAQFDAGLANGIIPADGGGAVSTSYVVSTLNNAYVIKNRSGGLIMSRNAGQFWCNGPQVVVGCPGTNLNPNGLPFISMDPRILYDAPNGRWVTTALGALLNGTTLQFLPMTYLAVSQTANPTSTWNLYYFYSCGNAKPGDQPVLGIDNGNGWLISKTRSCTTTIGVAKNDLHVFLQTPLYNGTPPSDLNHFQISDPNDGDMPASTYNPPPFNVEYMVTSGVSGGRPTLTFSYLGMDTQTGKPVLTSGFFAYVSIFTNATFSIPPGSTPKCNACVGTNNDARLNSVTLDCPPIYPHS